MAKIKKLKITKDKNKLGKITKEFDTLKNDLTLRSELWERLPPEKKTNWVKKDIDPVITEAYKFYVYLKGWFQEVQDG